MVSLAQDSFTFDADDVSTKVTVNLNDEIEETALKLAFWRNLQKLCNCNFFNQQVKKNERTLQRLTRKQSAQPTPPASNDEKSADSLMPYVVTIQSLSPDIFSNDYDWL